MSRQDQACPVCGATRSDSDRLTCGICKFPYAFVRCFTSPKAMEQWREEIRRSTKRPLPEIQALLADRLAVGYNQVSFLLPDAMLLVDGIYREANRDKNLIQISWSPHHTVMLYRNGTVSAQGNNECGQCSTKELRSIRQVIAASSCTYALREDGRVLVAGKPSPRLLALEQLPDAPIPVLKGWIGVTRLAYGEGHLVGLQKNGGILLGGFSSVTQSALKARAAQLRGVKAIAASTGGCTLALLENGKVRFLGKENDPRAGVQSWTDIVAVAVENSYAVGLTADGRIRLAGSAIPLLDMGRSAAAKWTEVAAIACGDSSIAGVTGSGELLLAGSLPRREALLAVWEREIRPAIRQMITG